MDKFELKESVKVPQILIDYKKGKISLIGRSTLNNPEEFYPRILDLFQQYIDNPQESTHVLIDLEYYTEDSSIFIFEIIRMLDSLTKHKKSEVKLFWHFDPDDYGIIGDINRLSSMLVTKIHAIAYELV